MLTFNQALEAYGLDPAEVRLLRHQNRGPAGRTPYTLWRDERALFESYQAAQEVQNRSRLDSGFWVSFIATPDGRTLLAGVYAVQGREPVPSDWPYPLSPRPPEGQDELYRLDPMVQYEELVGRLYIEWGGASRAWIQRADRQNKAIVALAERFAEPPFPGFSAFTEPLSRILALPPTWEAALAATKGIYLLTCPATKELYVGSATGAEGFLGRWRGYALTGHGGNVRLKSREPSDYRVSILEVAGNLAGEAEILALETRWKLKLQSREMGLNAN